MILGEPSALAIATQKIPIGPAPIGEVSKRE